MPHRSFRGLSFATESIPFYNVNLTEKAMNKVASYITRGIVFLGFIFVLYQVTMFTISKRDQNTNYTLPVTAAERDRQLKCLASNIFYEAGTEPFEGKVAVAQVTLNRANSEKYPNDICKVVFQKNVVYDKVICQFSWYCEKGNLNVNTETSNYKESMVVAKKVLLEDFRLPSLTNAMYYHADYVSPNWNLPKITKIGRHIFYGEKT